MDTVKEQEIHLRPNIFSELDINGLGTVIEKCRARMISLRSSKAAREAVDCKTA